MDISSTVLNGSDINSTLTSQNRTGSFAVGGWEKSALAHTAAEEFWQLTNVVALLTFSSSGLDDVGGVKWELLLCLFISWAIIFGCVFKGVKSVGKAVYVTATLPYIFLFILLVRGLTLPGGPSGALFYLTPDFSKLLDIQVWLAACAQVFFSLGPAWGGIITLASYNTFHADCLR
ncbi:sodium-dependent proline transporter-like [Haliotis rubra]|uniref:sodium-dependent proline transporter-like n=1 Tax=Haliotis rubra TaxID=36100 RepID=UPI001EE58C9C|nr:sodium-dependent proline transporter-like [Haliotis rubra]